MARTATVITMEDAIKLGPSSEGDLAVPAFSHGTLQMEWYSPDQVDTQTPHSRDEIYVIAKGYGEFFNGLENQSVSSGTSIFVPAGVEHRFENFSNDFAVWVFFYGPEGGEQG